MVKKQFLIKIFILLTLFLLPISTVKSAELDKYKSNDTPEPYYAPLLFGAYGQKIKGQEEIPFGITSVSVNNEIVDITENKDVYAAKDDAIRVAGRAEPKSKVTVYFANKEITVNTKDNGNWLVLFSVTNLGDGRYIVSAKNDGLKENVTLFTLVIGKGKQVIRPILDTTSSNSKSFLDNKGEYLVAVLVVLLATALGWFFGSYTEKQKVKNNKIRITK